MFQQPQMVQQLYEPRVVSQSMQQPMFHYEPVEYIQYDTPVVKKTTSQTPQQGTRDLNTIIDTTIGEHINEEEVKILKNKIADLEGEISKILQKKLRKCCVAV